MEVNNLDELYLITKNRLEEQHGTITINFANKTHVYSGNDVIGNCLQEWLPDWFQHLGIDIRPGDNTQAFPDFVAVFDGVNYDVEVKAWNYSNSPAFDLANFSSFLATTYESPGKLDAHYFILGYQPMDDGFSQGFIVKKVYLKYIWEITAPSRKYPIGLQVKRGQPYAMRPFNFSRNEDESFENKNEFILAVKEAFELFPNTALPFSPDEWIERVLSY
ncbi:NgoBV family restriction endonuclease [Bacillus subtilis]|uniref:NgoBV family restriction endonuclease n=1 Tax=Bacillus subtilis TaxID=1423 RepID=UPI001EDD1CB1|nr:NgoBV family restriction endonuclease [Bacillus subtilis]